MTDLAPRIADRTARVGIIGLGYVGLPLALTVARAGFTVTGYDIDPAKIAHIARRESYIEAVPQALLAQEAEAGRLTATTDFTTLGTCDIIAICVPTPLTRQREPDLSYVLRTAQDIAATLRPGQLIILESTTYPGTTDGPLREVLQRTGLTSGRDFHLAFSPEREDPGNRAFDTSTIPKVVGGDGPEALALAAAFYAACVTTVVPVSSTATAEAVKITENVFRAVNIALVNELKLIYAAMGIDVWEVIEAAKTKPFGYMPFYPGPGLGGHCIPIDPFYLTWKSREFDLTTRFIELAGEINSAMPRHVVDRLAEALDRQAGTALSRARILVIGLAYKKNVPDTRESPALRLIDLIEDRGGRADYHDPHLPEIPRTRAYGALMGRASQALTPEAIAGYDAVLIATDHDAVDYAALGTHARLIVDTRNVMARHGVTGPRIVKA
ncbi:MAG: nucleotide sugar dehydrogenase [Gemmobacter sp.]